VRLACLAQLVNVIAPILTNASGLLRQTIYYPYSWALKFGSGDVLDLLVDSATYDVEGLGAVSYLDVAGTRSAADGAVTLFVLNRDLARPRQVEVVWEGAAPARLSAAQVLTGDDLKATNTFEAPTRVAPREFERSLLSTTASRSTFEAPPRSYTLLRWQ